MDAGTGCPLKNTVAILGGGAFGTAIGNHLARNIKGKERFRKEILLWIRGEEDCGAELINTQRANAKYLPGVTLESELVATERMELVAQADILILAVPSQFLRALVEELKNHLEKPLVLVSVIKGLLKHEDRLLTPTEWLGLVTNNQTAALSGANLAGDLAKGNPSEITLACEHQNTARLLWDLFNGPALKVTLYPEKRAVELCGALKNIVAMSYGMAKGLGLGENICAETLRHGMCEMRKYLSVIAGLADSDVFFESCGLADVFVSCLSGRNAAFGREMAASVKTKPKKGLQGPETAAMVLWLLEKKTLLGEFPLFAFIGNCSRGRADPRKLLARK